MEARREVVDSVGRTERQDMGYFDLSRRLNRDSSICRTFLCRACRSLGCLNGGAVCLGRLISLLLSRFVHLYRLRSRLFLVRVGRWGGHVLFRCRLGLRRDRALGLHLMLLGKARKARLWTGGRPYRLGLRRRNARRGGG
jgi:hypothetical protein